MAGSIYGTLFRITTWGESHGPALGAVVDGCPAGLSLAPKDIQLYLDRRKPGQSSLTSGRKESDQVQILSGVFEGVTTGTPISLLLYNHGHDSREYDKLSEIYRPGHADYTYDQKYAFRDYRGGGRASGRETAARVAAGAVAAKLLKELNIQIVAYTKAIGPIDIGSDSFSSPIISSMNLEEIIEKRKNPLCMPDAEKAEEAETYIRECMNKGDSCGGVIECRIHGIPAGIGEPVFDKLDAKLAQAVMSIGAVKAVEIGEGKTAATLTGHDNNDLFCPTPEGIIKTSNHAGGILGGISDGSDVIIRAHIKPTSSIRIPQSTVNKKGESVTLALEGRHDPVIVPRAVVVVESMAAITVADLLLQNMSAKMDNIKKVYN